MSQNDSSDNKHDNCIVDIAMENYAENSNIKKETDEIELELEKQEDVKINIMLGIFISILTTIALSTFITSIIITDSDIWHDWELQLVYSVPSGIIGNAIIWTCGTLIRIKFLKHYKFSKDEIEHIFAPRNSWTKATVEEYKKKFGDHTLRVVDGLPRKINHILTTLINLSVIAFWINEEGLKAQHAVILQSANIILNVCFYNSSYPIGWLIFASSCRIRDGKYARKNLMLVRLVSLTTFITIASIFAFWDPKITDNEKSLILITIYLPTAIGDACGEIFGSLYGKHQFKVWGIGAINKKSVEGTIAVFLGSFIPLLLVSTIFNIDSSVGGWWILIFVLSLQSTFWELVSARGTDNFVLPVFNLLVVWLWYHQYPES